MEGIGKHGVKKYNSERLGLYSWAFCHFGHSVYRKQLQTHLYTDADVFVEEKADCTSLSQ